MKYSEKVQQARFSKLEEARKNLREAYNLIEKAVGDTRIYSYVEPGILESISKLISEGHGFLCEDQNIDTIIQMLREGPPKPDTLNFHTMNFKTAEERAEEEEFDDE